MPALFFRGLSSSQLDKRSLKPKVGCQSFTRYSSIKVSLIVKYSLLLPHQRVGTILSSRVADRSFKPAKDHRLGRHLNKDHSLLESELWGRKAPKGNASDSNYQLPNLAQAHQRAISFTIFNLIRDYLDLFGRFLRITHPCAKKHSHLLSNY